MTDRPVSVLEVLGNAIVGGMETSVRRLLSHLPDAGFRITVACPAENGLARVLRAEGHDVAIVPLRDDPGWSSVHRLVALARRAGADVLHAHLPNAHGLAALAGTLAGTPVVATIHSMHVAVGDLEAHRLGDSDLVCVSDACAAHALAVGVDPGRIWCIPNALPRGLSVRRHAQGTPRPFRFGWIGRLSSEKNPELFLRAAARLADVPDLQFDVVGDGPLAGLLRSVASESALADRVRFHGEVRDAHRLLAGFDVLVSTSWHEGTPLVLLEALAAGVPVIATAVGGVPELVDTDLDGRLVPAGDERRLEGAMRESCPWSADYRPRRADDAARPGEGEAFEAMLRATANVLRTAAGRVRRLPPWRPSPSSGPGATARRVTPSTA